MSEVFEQLIKDPIFQLSLLVFIPAGFMGVWLIFVSKKNGKREEVTSKAKESQEKTTEFSQNAQFHIILENIKAINNRLDEIESVVKSARPEATSEENLKKLNENIESLSGLEEITRKLESIYKILVGLSGENK